MAKENSLNRKKMIIEENLKLQKGRENIGMDKNKNIYNKLKEKWPYKCHVLIANAKYIIFTLILVPVYYICVCTICCKL